MYLEAYYEALPFLYTTFIWITFFSLFAVVFGGIFVSHKAAGPIFRLHQVIKSLKNGNHQGEIKFREDDFFPEIERDLNELIKTLKK
jgi:signal transduction histidine kinase